MNKLIGTFLIISVMFSVAAAQTSENDKFFNDAYIKKKMKRALDWQLHHPKHKLYDWTNGAFYAGVFAAYETLADENIYNAIEAMGESNEWKAGPRLHHADDHAICQTYVDMYRISGDDEMIEPFQSTMEEFIATPYETGGIRKITWWWCDALFMGPPAFVKIGITLDKEEYIELSDKLFKETYDLLYDQEEDYMHAILNINSMSRELNQEQRPTVKKYSGHAETAG